MQCGRRRIPKRRATPRESKIPIKAAALMQNFTIRPGSSLRFCCTASRTPLAHRYLMGVGPMTIPRKQCTRIEDIQTALQMTGHLRSPGRRTLHRILLRSWQLELRWLQSPTQSQWPAEPWESDRASDQEIRPQNTGSNGSAHHPYLGSKTLWYVTGFIESNCARVNHTEGEGACPTAKCKNSWSRPFFGVASKRKTISFNANRWNNS